jgi:flagellar biosynthesis/type III secretory pathway M-ring protein FliF/YscJ
MKLRINIGEKKMNELLDKIKSMNKTTLAVVGIFAIIVIVNMLGYGG